MLCAIQWAAVDRQDVSSLLGLEQERFNSTPNAGQAGHFAELSL
jgi:hypothetical protein